MVFEVFTKMIFNIDILKKKQSRSRRVRRNRY